MYILLFFFCSSFFENMVKYEIPIWGLRQRVHTDTKMYRGVMQWIKKV